MTTTTEARKERLEAVFQALDTTEEREFALEDQRTEALVRRIEAARQQPPFGAL